MKQVCQPSSRYCPGLPIRLASGMNVRLNCTTWLAEARMPSGSHQDLSTEMEGSERSQASRSWDSTLPLLCLAPPGPAVLTSRTAQCALPALVANAFLPSTTYPSSTFVVVVPKEIFSEDARACGSPLHATHMFPSCTTPANQRFFCSSLAMPSSRTRELTCPSQQRVKARSAFAISCVTRQRVSTFP